MNKFDWIEEKDFYERLDKTITGLSFDLYVDDNMAYFRYYHPYIIIVSTQTSIIPIQVSKEGHISRYYDTTDNLSADDYKSICEWITEHLEQLYKLADYTIFFEQFIKEL